MPASRIGYIGLQGMKETFSNYTFSAIMLPRILTSNGSFARFANRPLGNSSVFFKRKSPASDKSNKYFNTVEKRESFESATIQNIRSALMMAPTEPTR